MRRLANCKNLDSDERYEFVRNCQGMVRVAHKGYHTLNGASARKHRRKIGDCMIEVRWSGKYDRSRHVLEPDFNTWETRSDWRELRVSDQADWEIYYFAKCRDNG